MLEPFPAPVIGRRLLPGAMSAQQFWPAFRQGKSTMLLEWSWWYRLKKCIQRRCWWCWLYAYLQSKSQHPRTQLWFSLFTFSVHSLLPGRPSSLRELGQHPTWENKASLCPVQDLLCPVGDKYCTRQRQLENKTHTAHYSHTQSLYSNTKINLKCL